LTFHILHPKTMPAHAQIHTTITALPTGPPLVIAIIAGTSGIGSYIAKAFASVYRNSGTKLRVYIVGRNTSRAEALLAHVRSTSPGSEWRFIKAQDLALMSDVDAVCAQIKRYEEEEPFEGGGGPRIDMLYMGQAIFPLAPSNREFSFSSSLLDDEEGGGRNITHGRDESFSLY
jgi:NAD(P)-dependent dehydrogenase (short-subunit alcohol dehydrogenase family)